MRRTILLISCLLVFVLGCNLFSNAEALPFNIGEKVESDARRSPFTSGVYANGNPTNLTEIFDGNLSTGIGYKNSSIGVLTFQLDFPYPIYVNNITFKPTFGGGTSIYNYDIYLNKGRIDLGQNLLVETFLQLNCSINYLFLSIGPTVANYYYFNDVIINHTYNFTDFSSINIAITNLENSFNIFQGKINNFNNDINNLNEFVNQLNISIFNLNNVQQQILENITNLWTSYEKLNTSIINLIKEIENINLTTKENITNLQVNYNLLNVSLINLYNKIENMNLTTFNNITQLENDLMIVQNNFNNIQQDITNLSIDVSKLPEIQNQIDQSTFKINDINDNITVIKNTRPSEYNETALKNRVIQLEAENSNLDTEIGNLNTELDNLKSELNELKENDDDEDKDEDGAENINTLAYGGLGLGIIGIIIALVAIAMLLKKKSPPLIPPETQEAPATSITTEQQTREETGGVVQQEQPPVTPEVQD